MKAFAQHKTRRADGSYDSYRTEELEVKRTETPRHGQTQSGYGKRLPTPYLVKFNGRWRRVYVAQYGNAGTAYIGPRLDTQLTIDIWQS
jgi:hypothetical protein